MAERRYVRMNMLKAGMISDQAITDRLDRVLVHRGAKLDTYVIEGLSKHGIPGLYIRIGEDTPEDEDPMKKIEESITPVVKNKIAKAREDDPAKVQLTETVRKRISTGMLNNVLADAQQAIDLLEFSSPGTAAEVGVVDRIGLLDDVHHLMKEIHSVPPLGFLKFL